MMLVMHDDDDDDDDDGGGGGGDDFNCYDNDGTTLYLPIDQCKLLVSKRDENIMEHQTSI